MRKIHNIDQPGNFLKQREQSHEITDRSLKTFFNCSQCDYIAKSKAGINYHNRTKHATEEDKYKCKFCAFISLKKLDLVDHIKNEHKVKFKVLKRSVKKNQNQGYVGIYNLQLI